jgi:hypothetical protein
MVIEGDCSMVATATQLDTVNLEIRDKEGEYPPSDIGNSEPLSQCPSNSKNPQIFPTQQTPKTSYSSQFPAMKRFPLSFFEIKILLHENDSDIDV